MACIINIETSTGICSAALAVDGILMHNLENGDGGRHSSLLGVYVAEILDFAREKGLHIDAVAVSAGPGSYTGLRIGVSEAKGLCFGLDVPLIAIPSLQIMADQVIRSGFDADYYCPMIDARRMEVYAAVYDRQLQTVRAVAADVVEEGSYAGYLSRGKMLFFGNGSSKCKPLLQSVNASFIEGINPLASSMVHLSEKSFIDKHFEDVAYFEPFYLKEFLATIAKNKVLL